MKKILRLTMVAAALLCSTFAKADTTVVGAEDNTTGFFTEFSNYYTIEPNKTLTLEFVNYTSGLENYHNWIVAVTTDADRWDTDNGYMEYFVLRADNWAWNAEKNSSDNSWFKSLSSNYNWGENFSAFRSGMNGAKVVMKITRNDEEVTVHADVTYNDNTQYYEEFVIDCGDGTQNIRAFLTVERAHLVIDNSKTTITDSKPEVREEGQVGKTDNTTGFFGEYEAYPVMDDETLTLDFVNYAGTANWNNFDVILSNVDNRTAEGYQEFAIIRADNYAWQVWDVATTAGPDKSWFTSMNSNYNWETFLADMDGAHVVLTIQRKGEQVTVHADITSKGGTPYFYDFIMPIPAGESLYALLGVDGSHLVLNDAACGSHSTPEGIVGLETNTAPFFTQFSDYYYLAPGKTLNVEFENHSSQLENYHNFIVALANDERGADGYSEYAVVRADNFAWNATTNTFDDNTWFTSLESVYNWDTFKSDLDGATVNLKVARDIDEPAKVTVRADITPAAGSDSYYEEFVMNCGDGTQDLVVFLTTDNGYLIVNTSTIEDSVSTGVDAVAVKKTNTAAPVFNLAGQRVAKAVKGVYVQDGKKFVVK